MSSFNDFSSISDHQRAKKALESPLAVQNYHYRHPEIIDPMLKDRRKNQEPYITLPRWFGLTALAGTVLVAGLYITIESRDEAFPVTPVIVPEEPEDYSVSLHN